MITGFGKTISEAFHFMKEKDSSYAIMVREVKCPMRKCLTVILALLLLAGCQKETRQLDEEKYNAYISYYQSILDVENKQKSSQHFDIKMAVNMLSEGNYRYDVIIDNCRVSMYDMEVLVIVDDVNKEINRDVMMPSIGIFEENEYSMIPNQVDLDKNIVQGIDLSITSPEPTLSVSVMVSYYDKNKEKNTREYFSLTASYQAPENTDGE